MEEPGTCPIWGTPAIVDISGSEVTIGSPRAAGGYILDTQLAHGLQGGNLTVRQKAFLTTLIIDRRWNQGLMPVPAPKISSKDLEVARRTSALPISARAERLLRCFALDSEYAGSEIDISFRSEVGLYRALAYSESTRIEELTFLTDYLLDQKWVLLKGGMGVVSIGGYQRLDELKVHVA